MVANKSTTILNPSKEHTSGSTMAERPRDARVRLLRFAKLRSGVIEPPFGGLRAKVCTLSKRRWKARDQLPISDK